MTDIITAAESNLIRALGALEAQGDTLHRPLEPGVRRLISDYRAGLLRRVVARLSGVELNIGADSIVDIFDALVDAERAGDGLTTSAELRGALLDRLRLHPGGAMVARTLERYAPQAKPVPPAPPPAPPSAVRGSDIMPVPDITPDPNILYGPPVAGGVSTVTENPPADSFVFGIPSPPIGGAVVSGKVAGADTESITLTEDMVVPASIKSDNPTPDAKAAMVAREHEETVAGLSGVERLLVKATDKLTSLGNRPARA